MSLIEKASLVMIPSGYKEDTVYSVIPSNGAGDLSFTRASDGTRINSAGLVENMPYNILQYSQDFTNGAWNKLGTSFSVTANTTTAPNGTLTASTLNIGANDNILYQAISSGLLNNTYTFSIYAKGSGTFSMRIRLNSTTTTTETKTLSSDWQRFSVTVTQSAAVTSVESYIALNTSSTYYVWGAQTVAGSGLKEYFPTTDRQNVPRLTYQNGGSGCPSLLLEPQRTNLFTYSEQFDNAAWTKASATVTANNTTAPDGNNTADKIEFNNGYIISTVTVTANQTYTISFFAKKGTANLFQISEAFYVGTTVVFDLNSGTVTSGTGKIENYGNDWYRCSMQFAYGVGQVVGSWLIRNYQSGYIYIYGAQLEAGAYATSYIPTTSASATRVAEACFKTGISSLIGQTEGTIFYDGIFGTNSDELYLFMQKSGSTGINDSIYLQRFSTTSQIYMNVYLGASAQVYSGGGSLNVGDRFKIAFAYASNDFVLYINGVQIATDTTGSVPTCANLQVGTYTGAPSNSIYMANKVNQVALFKTRLTNTELAQLTSL